MFETYLAEQFARHPSMRPQDVVKMCYQAAFGAEHLLGDPDAARRYLEQEFASVPVRNFPVYEQLSADVCRVNLAAWKARKLPMKWLMMMFFGSSWNGEGGKDRFDQLLSAAEAFVLENQTGFSKEEWDAYRTAYLQSGIHPVHHSQEYHAAEKPAYRVVSSRYLRILPILEKVVQASPSDEIFVIAIDGRAASGKTTISRQLQEILDADVIEMDDFFLPPALRTPERFAVPGGNVHYERFIEEVLPHIRDPKPFVYRKFDCGIMDYNGVKQIGSKQFRIVEGSYSCHPCFGVYADFSVFSTVSEETQLRRIRRRNGEKMLQMFQNRWIPLEENYFSCCGLPQRSDIVITE